jgi:hypothetical protein
MIWEEYRLHAIVFTLRCVVIFVVATFTSSGTWRRDRLTCLLFTVVMPLHVIVDIITSKYGTPNTTTVRVQNDHSVTTTLILRLYALYQFLALGAHLTPHPRLADLGYNSLIAIQSSAFLMTLVRKGLVQTHTHGLVYSLCLALSTYHILRLHNASFVIGVLVVYTTRLSLGPRVSKFLLWTGFAIVQSQCWQGRSILPFDLDLDRIAMSHGSMFLSS